MTINKNETVFEQKKKHYLERVDLIAKESFNNEQKEIAKQIIEAANENNIDSVYQLVTQRVKTGFVFDTAPEVNHNCVALVRENESLNIISTEATQNEHSLIIGENYDALKNLLATYINPSTGEGMIDIIYIDPPYNTEASKDDGNDYKEEVEASKFVYRDKFTRDGWLNMMNERLKYAKKLLTNKGVIFISIDDVEHAYLKVLCDEIFDEKNFIGSFAVIKAEGGGMAKQIVRGHDLLYVYAKDKNKFTPLAREKDIRGKIITIDNIEYWIQEDAIRKEFGTYGNLHYEEILEYRDQSFKNEIDDGIEKGKYILVPKDNGMNIIGKLRRVDEDSTKFYSVIKHLNKDGVKTLKELKLNGKFQYPKPVSLIKELIKGASFFGEKKQIILDFFAGSGTTGQAVMELNEEDGGNRKFLLVTNNENNIALVVTRERLYRVIHGKGSKDEKIDWKYSDEKPSLINNSVKVFDIEYHELGLNDFEKANKLIPIAEDQFKKLNPKYKAKDRFDIYNELAALNPYKKV